MGEIVSLTDRRQRGRRLALASGDAVEVEHIATVAGTRVSIVAQPEGDPGWVHVVVSGGIGTPFHPVFPAPDRLHGTNVARIIANAVVRALRALTPGEEATQPEPYTADEIGLHAEIIRADGDPAAPLPPCEPDGAA